MADVQTLRKGNVYEEDNQLLKVLEYQHIKVARGGATIRVKVRNLRTGSTVEKTYNNGARVNDRMRSSISTPTANFTTSWIPRPSSRRC